MYRLLKIDTGLAALTRAEWEKQFTARPAELLVSSYQKTLDWADKFAAGNGAENTYVYGLICQDGSKHACAILEISHVRPNSAGPWLKVLAVNFEPNMDVRDGEAPEIVAKLSSILAYVFLECLKLTLGTHKSKTLKVLAKTDVEKGFLEALAVGMVGGVPGLTFKVYGKWLELNMPD